MVYVKWICVVIFLLGVAFFAVGLMLPSEYAVERSIVIDAPREAIHHYVGELRNWPEWTPWEEMDPEMVSEFGAQTTGVGASQSWTGKSGSGELTFTSCDLEQGIAYDMDFDEGAFLSVCRMIYEDDPNGVKVTWTMNGDVGGDLIGRYFTMMMDKWVGPPFEQGLAKLKAVAEAYEAPVAEPAPAEEGEAEAVAAEAAAQPA